MLSQEDNELLTRVGPGTPMGSLLRQYWVPVMLGAEVPDPGGDPQRVPAAGAKTSSSSATPRGELAS